MIGIFGQFYLNSLKDISLRNMIGRIPDRLKKKTYKGRNFHVGIANHDTDYGCSFYQDTDGSFCIFIGEAVVHNNPNIPNIAEHLFNLIDDKKFSRVSDLNGMFSAILVYPRKNSFKFVSDRLGTWPLFIWHEKDHYVFSSNLYTLLGCQKIKAEIDTQAVLELFSFNRIIGSTCPIKNVEYFSPATIMEIDNTGVKKHIYWNLEFFKPKFKLQEAPHILAEELKKSLLASSGSGLLLSGGLDSRLVLAASPKNSLRSYTTASYKENPELDIAKKIANSFNSEHMEIITEPHEDFEILDETIKANNCMFPASTIMATFLPKVAEKENIILTGHGLDYTFRGYYLPAKFISFRGSHTRLPILRKFGSEISGETIFENLRQGSPLKTIERIFGGINAFADHKALMVKKIYSYLEPWILSEYPENAWDAFIVKSVSQHYAFTSMMPVRNLAILRIPAFDINVFNVYQNLIPEWRVTGDIPIKALEILSTELANIKNANTLMKMTLDPKTEIIFLFARAFARKVGLLKKPQTPSSMHSYRSWHNTPMVYRLDKNYKNLINDIQKRLDWVCCGVLSVDDVNKCIIEHQNFKKDHSKFIRQLISLDSWMRITQ